MEGRNNNRDITAAQRDKYSDGVNMILQHENILETSTASIKTSIINHKRKS